MELVDLCWRPSLSVSDIEKVSECAIAFYNHFEGLYYRFEADRANHCKFAFHLLLHLKDCIVENGPRVLYSQYWMEIYIGWIMGRFNARRLASSSLFNNAVNREAYKSFFLVPFATSSGDYDSVFDEGGLVSKGKGWQHYFSQETEDDHSLCELMKGYPTRKYSGMSRTEANELLATVEECTSIIEYSSSAAPERKR